MVENASLGNSLIQLIENVSAGDSQENAAQILLKSLLEIFKMDRAALFEKTEGEARGLFAIDRTGRILRTPNEVFFSSTIFERSLLSLEPLDLSLIPHDESIPVSIKGDALQRVVCLPLSRNPASAIFMGSRQPSTYKFTEEEMHQFKTAARASWLAIRHFKTQESLVKTRSVRQAKLGTTSQESPPS